MMFRKTKKRPKTTILRTQRSPGDEDDDDHDDAVGAATTGNDNQDDRVDGVAVAASATKRIRRDKNGSRPSNSINAKKALKARTFAGVTVAAQEDDEDDVGGFAAGKKASSRKRRGLGFGGGGVDGTAAKFAPSSEYNDYDGVNETSSGAGALKATSIRYDRETLSKLQSEQKRFVVPVTEATEDQLQQSNSKDETLFRVTGTNVSSESLNGIVAANDTTGDSYEAETAELHAQGISKANSLSADAWEAQVAQRAGIRSKTTSHAPTSRDDTDEDDDSEGRARTPALRGGANASAPGHGGAKLLSMQQVRHQVETTLHQQQDRMTDLNTTLRRRENQREHIQTELKTQKAQVEQSGQAVEYYQILRQRLVVWVGALRQLQSRVIPIQQAMHDVEASMASMNEQRLWEDDVMKILFDNNRLEQVIGRQPDPSLFDPVAAMTIDEFGRDVKSQEYIQREQRARKRQRVKQQRQDPLNPVRGDETDVFLTDDEKETLRERHNALVQALQVAMDEIDPEFINLQNICNVFKEWKKEFPDDYEQCYASLSLADLASVLIQAELCSLNDPWNESQGYNEGKWIAVIHAVQSSDSEGQAAGTNESSVLDKSAVRRILEKAVYPSICDLLDKDGYDLVSKRQARSLSNFCKHVHKLAASCDDREISDGGNYDCPILAKLRHRLIAYMGQYLQQIAIPIVKPNNPDQPMSQTLPSNPELEDTVHDATFGLMLRIKKLILNLLHYWAPILGQEDSFVGLVLDFITNKYLFMLSSVQQHQMVTLPKNLLLAESPPNAFNAVYNALLGTGWLEDMKWMLQAAPIRASAAVYTSPSS